MVLVVGGGDNDMWWPVVKIVVGGNGDGNGDWWLWSITCQCTLVIGVGDAKKSGGVAVVATSVGGGHSIDKRQHWLWW